MTATENDSAATPSPRSGRGRIWGVRGLVVLGSLLLVLGALGVFVERVALQTSNWTDTSSRVLADPTVDQTLATYLVDQLYANVDVAGELREALPPRAKPLAAPAAAGLRNLLVTSAERAIASPQAQNVWRRANERANRQLLKLLDDGSGALKSSNGEVVLDLRPLVNRISGNSAVTDRVGTLPPDTGRIVLLRSDQLKSAQTATKILRAISLFLLPLILLIYALAIWLAPDRRRALGACAIGVLTAGLLLVFLRRVLGDELIDRLVANDAVRPAIHNVWWIATDQLGLANASILFVGIVGIVGTWFAGPGRRATAWRGAVSPFLRDNRSWLALAAIVLVLLAWAPTPAARNWVTVILLTVMAVIGFEALRRQTAHEFPPGQAREALTSPRSWGRGAPAATTTEENQRIERLGRLAQLHTDGVLSDEEFTREKARVLEGS
jgi:hypothetical protein